MTMKTMDEASAHCNQRGYASATQLTKSGNAAEVTQTFASQVSNSIRIGLLVRLQHVLLRSVKYICLVTYNILSIPSHHFVYGGVLEINRIVVVYLLAYISARAHYLHFIAH